VKGRRAADGAPRGDTKINSCPLGECWSSRLPHQMLCGRSSEAEGSVDSWGRAASRRLRNRRVESDEVTSHK
jgi:hypothetical protein